MQLLLEALRTKYIADKNVALAELSVILQSPVGIGDHTNIVADADIKIATIAESEDKLRILHEIAEQNLPHLNEGNKNEQNEQ